MNEPKLTYEEWRNTITVDVPESVVTALRPINVQTEIEAALRQEYNLYLNDSYYDGDE